MRTPTTDAVKSGVMESDVNRAVHSAQQHNPPPATMLAQQSSPVTHLLYGVLQLLAPAGGGQFKHAAQGVVCQSLLRLSDSHHHSLNVSCHSWPAELPHSASQSSPHPAVDFKSTHWLRNQLLCMCCAKDCAHKKFQPLTCPQSQRV